MNRDGFTFIELIFVILIVGLLASLAIPRYFSAVEFARSTEALNAMSTLRQSMARCYLSSGGTYNSCLIGNLDMGDPSSSPGTHFTYGILSAADSYTITATRNSFDGGTEGDTIVMEQTESGLTQYGTGNFHSIK